VTAVLTTRRRKHAARIFTPAGPHYLTAQSMAAMPDWCTAVFFRVLFVMRITSAELADEDDNFELQYSEVLFWLMSC